MTKYTHYRTQLCEIRFHFCHFQQHISHVWSSPSKISNTIINHQTFNNKQFNAWLPIVKQYIIRFALYYTTTWLLTSIQLWACLFYLLTYLVFILVLPNPHPHINHLPRWTNIHISNLHFFFGMAILSPKNIRFEVKIMIKS